MFGHDWQPGRATIVALKEVKTIGNDAWTGAKLQGYEYVADVQPDGAGAAFRTVMSDPFDETHWRTPRVGDVLAVKCDPGRQKAKFDTATLRARDKAQTNAAKREQEAQFDAARNATPGSIAPSQGADAQLGDLQSTVAGISGAVGRLSALSDELAAIEQAKASGDRAELERLKAEFRARALQNAAAARQAADGLAREPVQSDPLERLRTLSELHDRGDLTDAEFASAKARILGQE
jgi:Short C-terminal domain